MRPRLAGGQVPLGDLARAARPLLGNLAGARIGRPGDAPSFVTWALTERCPLTCEHCDMGAATPELRRPERIALAHRLAATDVWGISLIGGEASVIPELGDLAAILKHAGKFVSIGTSGLGWRRHVSWVRDLPIDSITFSVDSHDAAAHDRFRGRPGLFDEVVQAVDELRTGDKPQVQVRCTIHRGNFEQLEDFVDFWRPRVDQILLQVVQDNGIHTVRDRSCLFVPEDRPAFEAAMTSLQARHPFLRSRYLDLAARYLFEPEALYDDIGFRCLLVPGASATILPDGGVKLCYGREDSRIGNLLDASLRDLWTSDSTASTRQRMQARDYGCMCWEQACSGNLELVRLSRARDAVLGR